MRWIQPCYARVQDIQPPVDGALLMTKPENTEEVVADCAWRQAFAVYGCIVQAAKAP